MQTEFCGGIGSVDRGLWRHRLCRQRSVGASGVQTEVFVGIGSTDIGRLWSSGLKTELWGASGLLKEVRWGHWVCRQKSVEASDLQTEVSVGIGYADRDK